VSDTAPPYPPPRNVVYFRRATNSISLAGIANLPYTDVIVGFLIPGSNGLAGNGPAFTDTQTLQNNIQLLQSAGKNVLISVGGEVSNKPNWTGWSSPKYELYSGKVPALVKQIVSWVDSTGADGVDIDFEDSGAFTGKAGYDGITFLSELTSGLSQALPSGSIITHAPQTPYWDTNSEYKAAYSQVHSQVGNSIAWYNNQFYNNSRYDGDAATKVASYLMVAGEIGPTKLLMGVSIDPSDEGAIGLDDMTQNVIAPLLAQFPPTPQSNEFGGVTTWEFAFDNGGAWANGIAQTLGL
jgi:glycosyl hydrolase family 18 (putative chitinase)